MSSDMEKGSKSWGSRLSFIRTKRALAALSLLVVFAVIMIILGATHTIGGNSSADSKQASSGNINSTSTSSPTLSQGTSQPLATASTLPTASPTQTLHQTAATSTATPSSSISGQYNGSLAAGTSLRVMCLGASIVKGETSPGTVGFRQVLRNDLVGFGVEVNMVGSVRLGDMLDNDLEAYGGNTILQIHDRAKKIVPQTLPNVFVINLGTNNILQQVDIDKAGEQMGDFIDYLLDTSPRSFVILSTLLTNNVPNMEQYVLDINQQYRDLVSSLRNESKSVVLAELHPGQGGGDEVPQVADIGPDGSHPLVSGYEKMGHILAQAAKTADTEGLMKIATDNGVPADGDAGRTGSSKKSRRR